MDIRRYVDTSGDMAEVSKARETGTGRALLTAAKARERQIVDELVTRPMRSDKISESMEFKLGEIAGLRFSEKLVDAVEQYVNGLKQEGVER